MATVITMIITFIATGMDEMLILIVLFAHARNHKQIRQVYIGQQIGMTFVLLIAVVVVYWISFITEEWTGLLGFLPIIIGIMELFERDDEDEESSTTLQKTAIFSNLTVRVAIIAIAGGAEELAIFIPYFTSLNVKEVLIAILTFILLVPIWSAICHILGSVKQIYTFVGRFQRFIIPMIFIGIGVKVLLESDAIETLLDLFL
ncbi:cadmium resistance transporter [Ornithinibacillus bavariensis]|uniref:Cadmium resistance protein CadD n=1 Tax=Ornithinibacillus bavariensis TaxID=545502 RepID=A0A919XC37_9BACI|nr:cadmium resistance transporter [Ornithinibacillus bavariensis]GIO27935.1 cadmium resistance protein CadD [Ornithinibacillus bavariensis]